MIRACHACGRQNRIPARFLSKRGRCGACKAELAPLDEPLDADRELFDAVTREAQVPVLVDFWAPWCGPCRMVAPEVRKAAARLAGKAIVLKVDTDQNQDLAGRFDIRGIPAFVVFSGGRAVARQAGAVSQSALVSLVERAA